MIRRKKDHEAEPDSAADPHPLFRFHRRDEWDHNVLTVDPGRVGPDVPETILGNFLEHLSFAIAGGVSAELLSNPTFAREHHLTPPQLSELVGNGRALVRLYVSGGDPAALDPEWVSTPLATGFAVAILDEATALGVPLGWGPLGAPGAVKPSVGRMGGAVRLRGGRWPEGDDVRWPELDDGPAGIRQGVFLPAARCGTYEGSVWLRIATAGIGAHGEVEVGLRRRVATPDRSHQAGQILASERLDVGGSDWQPRSFRLEVGDGQVAHGEPVDFYVRWIPRSDPELHLLVDRVSVVPADAMSGLDPDVIRMVRRFTMPRLRWPGGNFVSYYHWRDGVGPVERRPTHANRAWGGLEYNLFGTDEYMEFCRLVGTKPHITVNSGSGTPEEAAAWVEYCNGSITTSMGALRARNGHPEPYDVRIWEVGNENFGSWQGGFHGSDENARRFREFAAAMRPASSIPIELIACGSNFDFAEPGAAYDHVTADRRWHDRLLEEAPDEIDYISLHSLPVNDLLLEGVSDEQAHLAVLAQVTTWERRFLPELLRRCDAARRDPERPPIRIAITEWGPLGAHPGRLMVENFGAVVYAATFLNFMIRNSERIPIASPNGFMHGGCIRKAIGLVFVDPQVQAMQQYGPFVGARPVACELTGPGYDVARPSDLGAADADVPFLDVVVCRPGPEGGYLVAVANRHLTRTMTLDIHIPDHRWPAEVEVAILAYPDITARATPAEPNRFALTRLRVPAAPDTLSVSLPPFSAAWIRS